MPDQRMPTNASRFARHPRGGRNLSIHGGTDELHPGRKITTNVVRHRDTFDARRREHTAIDTELTQVFGTAPVR